MFSFLGMSTTGKYGVKDSRDGIVEELSYDEILYCVRDLGIDVKGVIFAKRTGVLICEKIRGGNSKSTEFFKEEVYNLVGDDYTVIGEYITSNVKIMFRHNICGHEYLQKPRFFLAGKRCPKCFGRVKDTTEGFRSFMQSVVGNEYSLLSEYIGADVDITVRHNMCGNVYNVVASGFKRGQRCPKCAKSGAPVRTLDQMQAIVKARSVYYEILEYSGSAYPAKFKHLVCGTVFSMKPYTFTNLNGRYPNCRHSVPEKLIQNEVEQWFDCEFNYRPDWLVGKKGCVMELDVYIPSIKTAVEYDSYGFHIDRIGKDSYKDICCCKNGVRMVRLREYGLPRLNTDSIQIISNGIVRLNRYGGVEYFEEMMTNLLQILGINKKYRLDRDLVNKLYDNASLA